MKSNVCIALDFQTKQEVLDFLDQFTNESLYVKVGMDQEERTSYLLGLETSRHS